MSFRRAAPTNAKHGDALLDRIAAGGIPDRALAERALRLTLSVLGQRLTDR
jgi:hypothetical protein